MDRAEGHLVISDLFRLFFRSLIQQVTLGHFLRTFGLAQFLRLASNLLGAYFRSQWVNRSFLGTERAFRRIYGHIVAQGLPTAYAPAVGMLGRRNQRRFGLPAQLAMAAAIIVVGWFYLPQSAVAPETVQSSFQPASAPQVGDTDAPLAQQAQPVLAESIAVPPTTVPALQHPLPTAVVLQTIPDQSESVSSVALLEEQVEDVPGPVQATLQGDEDREAALASRLEQAAQQAKARLAAAQVAPVAHVLDLRPSSVTAPDAKPVEVGETRQLSQPETAQNHGNAPSDQANTPGTSTNVTVNVGDTVNVDDTVLSGTEFAASADAAEGGPPIASAPVPGAPLVMDVATENAIIGSSNPRETQSTSSNQDADQQVAGAALNFPPLPFTARPPMLGMNEIRDEIEAARASQSFEVDFGTGLSSLTSPAATQPATVAAEGGRTGQVPGGFWPTFAPPTAVAGDHYWLDFSFPGEFNQMYSPGYQFGSTAGGRYRIHHGIDISNAAGTPVLAGASGEVVHAGPDNPHLLGPYTNFYGNAVVVRLDQPLITPEGERDVYVLYGHLLSVTVQRGQRVEVGDFVGGVGMTGIAIGPHLHLEVRVGQNSYQHTVNPALWVRPLPGTGTVAVRLLSSDSRTWSGVRLGLLRYDADGGRWVRTIETYPEQEAIGPDPTWGENGALSNIPAGNYYVVARINGERVGQDITVRPGETTFVELRTQQ